MIKNEKGLTLIELLAVIVILAIISAIAIPSIGNIIDNSKYNAIKADAINVLNAAQLYFLDNPEKTEVSSGYLLGQGYLESPGKIPGEKLKDETTNFEFDSKTGNPQSIIRRDEGENYLNTNSIYYSGSKTIGFSNATIGHITKDNRKGSSEGEKYIGKQGNG